MEDKINSDISYVNKDFQSIYNELLDLVKKLTTKWDPSLSNESDPGVLLLKLNALIADKNNYNIDKNVLECFPLSVTQDGNARKLYDSLGYKMHWYKSATTQVGFQLLVEPTDDKIANQVDENGNLVISAWTYLNDSTGEVIYTTLQDVSLSSKAEINYSDVIEGKVLDYTINGENIITINNLDNDLRIYFEDTMIAENGIYIKNVGDTYYYNPSDLETWKRVDNLASYPLNSKVFEFGVLPNTNTCYIQFPSDIVNLIKEGLNIKYTISNGLNGNIKSNTLTNFYSDESNDTLITNNVVRIIQPTAATNGVNPETLDDAYRNYKKTIGTFNTLVSRRDYENYLYNAQVSNKNVCSNLIVSDRTNDINESDRIITWTPNGYNSKLVVSEGPDDDKWSHFGQVFNAYNICLYMLKPVESIYNDLTYNQTFDPYDTADAVSYATALMGDVKSVQHDILTPSTSASDLYNFNNMYEIKGTLYTYHKVTKQEKKEIESNVKQALYNAYNSRQVEYGEELTYSDVVNIIASADSRIKTVALNTFDTNVVKVYSNASSESSSYNYTTLEDADKYRLLARMILAGNVQLFKFDDSWGYDFGQTDGTVQADSNVSTIKSITSEVLIDIPATENAPYILKKNESIQMLSENYITTQEYSTFVRYNVGGSSTTQIPKNTNYVLGAGESIHLTYTDTNNLPQVVDLVQGDVIESSINLKTSANTSADTSYSSSGVLASGQYIRKKSLNTSNLTYGSKFYFVLNNSTNRLHLDSTGGANPFYILKENEYFIYLSANSSEMIIYGSGTKISISSGYDFDCTISNPDLSGISESDAESIDWKTLTAPIVSAGVGHELSDFNLIFTEMDIITLGQNSCLYADTNINDVGNTLAPIGNNTIYYKYDASDSDWNTISNESSISPWQIQSRLAINTSKDSPQYLAENQSITLTFTNNATSAGLASTYIVFNEAVSLSGGQNIDAKVLNEEGEFEYSLELYTYTQSQASAWTPSSATYDFTRNDAGLIVLTGENASYTLPYSFGSSVLDYDKSYVIPVYILSSSDSLKVDFTATGGGHVYKFEPNASSTTSATSLTGKDGKTYILRVTDGTGLSIALANQTSSDRVYIGNITKLDGYNNDEFMPVGFTASTLLSKISEIDISNEFYYPYSVSDADKVLLPLESSSFWNSNHIYNAYTLPRIDFSKFNVSVNSTSLK